MLNEQTATAVKTIGINRNHGSSLCLADGHGRPLFCASEERFTRHKLQAGMPYKTFDYATTEFDLSKAHIAVGRLNTKQRMIREVEYYFQCSRKSLFTIPITKRISELAGFWYSHRFGKGRRVNRLSIDTRALTGRSVDFGFEHHLCHMVSAYFCSGFDEAVVVSIDGVGDLLSAVVGYGKGKDLRIEQRYFQSEHMAGQAYEVVTAMLGFHPDRHPGKVTGLAAYEVPAYDLVAEFDKWFSEQFRRGGQNWFYLIHEPGKEAVNIEKLRRVRETRFGRWSRKQIASAIQFILERDVLATIKAHVVEPVGKNIAVAGGVFANVKLNQRVKALGFDQIFVQPAMGDEGTALGAAMLAAHRQQAFAPFKLRDVYWGPGYSSSEIRRCLDRAGLAYEELTGPERPLERKLAQLLYEGYIIARFQGRMEFGPRALGNRSILYHTTDPLANDWLNKQLKRSEFMPFAPVTLWERAQDCYKNISGAEYSAEFMTITFDVTEQMARQSPACVHVDGTARPQLIREETNPSYYWTLKFYCELSGIPSLINTSFNMHEEPIVCTPEEAIRAYQMSNLDALAIGDFLVINEQKAGNGRQR